ncbi:MAG: hypothetical protein UV01_C0006G0033 [Parcubacteria group bacterium GW2011_GWA2_42_14]|nr:MAG: hypothetical protein UV01_C0006G0033 [Parcubacteria group bacterium GW2011_GWA2_42_14]OGZ97408.1 MAG: hypothetical protein A3D41_05575 [Candidatus Sungbacteria bacterium RIFCSPHIGHO2_02_FULL_41_12b]
MRRIWFILALGLFISGFCKIAESSPFLTYNREFHGYAVKNIEFFMKKAGFILVKEKIEVITVSDTQSRIITLFRIETYPDALKKYFRESQHRFFSAETEESKNALYLSVRAYLDEDSEGRVRPAYTGFYYLRLAKEDVPGWRKIIDSEKILAEMKNKTVSGLTGISCVSRSEAPSEDAKKLKGATGTNSRLTPEYFNKFPIKADAFISLLFKELKDSYNLRFSASEVYPVVRLEIIEFPKELVGIISPIWNRAVLEYNSKNGRDWLKIINYGRLEKETSFFTVELSKSESLASSAKRAAKDIFNGFYFPSCIGQY